MTIGRQPDSSEILPAQAVWTFYTEQERLSRWFCPNDGFLMVDLALGIAGIASTIIGTALLVVFPQMRKSWGIAGLIGGVVLLVTAGGLLFIPAGAQAPGVQQNNQSAPNFNVPGSNNQFNIYASPQGVIPQSDAVYQDGVVVGKAFGARRAPNDVTTFQFTEITNCQQLNLQEVFIYDGYKLRFVSEQGSAMMLVGRIADSPIRFGVMAKIEP